MINVNQHYINNLLNIDICKYINKYLQEINKRK